MRAIAVLTYISFGLTGCANQPAHDVANLATIISGHINTLNQELSAFVTTANDVRTESAARLADAQIRAKSDIAYNDAQITVWKVASNTKLVNVMTTLRAASDADMAVTVSDLKQKQDAASNLTASYGKVAYDAKGMQDIVSSLQSLAGRESKTNQMDAVGGFVSALLKDMKQQTAADKASLSTTPAASSKVNSQNQAVAVKKP